MRTYSMKKIYVAPQIEFIEVREADIIATSGTIVYDHGTWKSIDEGTNTVWGTPVDW